MVEKKFVLVYDNDLTKIDIVVFSEKEQIDLFDEQIQEFDNYMVLDKNLQNQLKNAVKKL